MIFHLIEELKFVMINTLKLYKKCFQNDEIYDLYF